MDIYRVMLPENHEMDVIYPIGCQTSYTGFWTTSYSDAVGIFDYISNSYFLDVNEECENIVISTDISNVVLNNDFGGLKTDNNQLFDKNEIFVEEILNKDLISTVEPI